MRIMKAPIRVSSAIDACVCLRINWQGAIVRQESVKPKILGQKTTKTRDWERGEG